MFANFRRLLLDLIDKLEMEGSFGNKYKFRNTSGNVRLILPPLQIFGDDEKTDFHIKYNDENSLENCIAEKLKKSLYQFLGCYPQLLGVFQRSRDSLSE